MNKAKVLQPSLLKSIYKKILPLGFRNFIRNRTDIIGPKCCLILLRMVYRISFPNGSKVSRHPKTVLFYPEIPSHFYGIYRICYILRYKMINDPNKPFDIVINWEDCTWRSSNEILSNLINNHSCLNAQCRDISKKRVQSLFEEVFGYPLAVDPLTHQGECVMKSNANYVHDGEVIKCPAQKTNDDFVYQKLINNRFGNKFVEDIRIPFFKDRIPFVFLKYRHFDNRFSNYFKSIIADTDKIFSQDEIKNIIRYSQKIGLEYGELDVLRDKNDGRIYIVDVNTTPASPRYFSLKENWRVLKNMAESFEETFASEKNPTSHLRKN